MKRVLVVDDSPIVRAATRHALVDAGYQVETRKSFEDLEERGVAGFDLILMDVQMPQLFGDDVAMALRHHRELATPIYLYSTLDAADLADRVRDAGIDGYISKSAGMESLVRDVRRILS
jgi:CheY-like chemotaxis protein